MNPAELSEELTRLFPAGAVAAQLREPGDPALLFPAEAARLGRSIAKRVGEFAAGRLCARRALQEFNIAAFPIETAEDRQPIWPPGIVGSITHTAGFCAAVAAPSRVLSGLGLDCEVVGAVKRDLWSSICDAEELAWLDSLPTRDRAAAVTLLFSAKEAFYKLQYPLVRQHLGFHDVRVIAQEWGGTSGGFRIESKKTLTIEALVQGPLHGLYLLHEEFISAGMGCVSDT